MIANGATPPQVACYSSRVSFKLGAAAGVTSIPSINVSYRAVDLQIAKAKEKREAIALGWCSEIAAPHHYPKLISLVIPTAMNCGRRWW